MVWGDSNSKPTLCDTKSLEQHYKHRAETNGTLHVDLTGPFEIQGVKGAQVPAHHGSQGGPKRRSMYADPW
eukprot:2858146-Prorocentrum_lima.AAC.1